jgi:predicted component of type VI protein secretion system
MERVMAGFEGYVTGTAVGANEPLTPERLQEALDNLRDRPRPQGWPQVTWTEDSLYRDRPTPRAYSFRDTLRRITEEDINQAIAEYERRLSGTNSLVVRTEYRQQIQRLHQQRMEVRAAMSREYRLRPAASSANGWVRAIDADEMPHLHNPFPRFARGISEYGIQQAMESLVYLRQRQHMLERLMADHGENSIYAQEYLANTRERAERATQALSDLTYTGWTEVNRRWQELYGDEQPPVGGRAQGQG